jgi:four helix bundle protein
VIKILIRIKICIKEAKETRLWLRLINETNDNNETNGIEKLINETDELRKIFTTILKNRKSLD